MKSCFFIGHRDCCEEIMPSLLQAVERHIVRHGVTDFLVGHYGRFDSMAAKAVVSLKEHYPDITLSLLLPYHPSERIPELSEGFDGSLYPPDMENVPKHAAIVRANRYAVDHSDYLIAYICHTASNAKNLLEYAQTRAAKGRISITNLADCI